MVWENQIVKFNIIFVCLLLFVHCVYANEEEQFDYLSEDFAYNPVQNSLSNITETTDLSADEILSIISWQYQRLISGKKYHFPNDNLARMHKLFVTWDHISRLRFKRGILRLDSQKSIIDLMAHIMKSRWYREFLVPVTSRPIYDYSESTSVRINIAAHTGAHFFQIPFPTLFCLLFQESKFDFKIRSFTGALGLGQLTKVGIEQVSILRKKKSKEKRLQAAALHLSNIYKDPVILSLLKKMGFHPNFPKLEKFPKEIKKFSPLSETFIKEVRNELLKRGRIFAHNKILLETLLKREFNGAVLPGKYAAVHPAALKVTERLYGRNYGNVLNVETNILTTAMLLKFYLNYPWKLNGKRIKLSPCVRTVAAIAAYNQGQAPIMRFFSQLVKTHPEFNLEIASVDELRALFTKKNVSKALKGARSRTNEIISHVTHISDCWDTKALK